jgi:hypothetical protein
MEFLSNNQEYSPMNDLIEEFLQRSPAEIQAPINSSLSVLHEQA